MFWNNGGNVSNYWAYSICKTLFQSPCQNYNSKSTHIKLINPLVEVVLFLFRHILLFWFHACLSIMLALIFMSQRGKTIDSAS